jgi:hypothetical protein
MLGKIFPAKNPALNRSYALGLYWCLSRVLPTYEIKGDEHLSIGRNFERLDQQRLEAMNRDYSEAGDELYQRLSEFDLDFACLISRATRSLRLHQGFAGFSRVLLT